MAVQFRNYAYSYEIGNGKPVFAPSERGRKIGLKIKQLVEAKFDPDPFFFHLRRGGHLAALHAHRRHRYFARLDIENFFYGIGRNRVTRALHEIGVDQPRTFGKWSCVRNPYGEPSYALPYGFIQSPLLATLVLARSGVGPVLRELSKRLTVSVYVDDVALSGNNRRVLRRAYRKLTKAVQDAGFTINVDKSAAPGTMIDLFNCHLRHMRTIVTEARRAEFYSRPKGHQSAQGFETYCTSVRRGNANA